MEKHSYKRSEEVGS